jgi:hypothetical protein
MEEKVLAVAPRPWIDVLGTTVSIACAIQCSIFPLLVSVLPLLGLGFLLGESVERFFLATSIILAVSSFIWGFRYHRRFYVFLFLVSAAALIIAGRLWVDERNSARSVGSAGSGDGPFFKSESVPALRQV